MEEIINLTPANKTKDFKKIIIHLVAIVVIIGLFYSALNRQKNLPMKREISTVTNEVISPTPMLCNNTNVNSCTKESCLYKSNSVLEGYGKLKGYYTKHTRDLGDWGNGGTETCNAIVVTGGTEELINEFKELINKGNTVNSLNKNGELMVNISLKAVSEKMRNEILASKPGKEITLNVIRASNIQDVIDSYSCLTLIEIIESE